jgi:imidazole glycerol-phosphate synthase subunit HisF
MLKTRLIPCLVLRNNVIVQSVGFRRYLPVGSASISIEFVANWDVDEIFLVDITASKEQRKPDYNLIRSISRKCFVPLTVGGGIHEVGDIRQVIRAGGDKISINSEAVKNPDFITEGARLYGRQCIVVSIDVKRTEGGRYEVFVDSGKRPTGLDAVAWAKTVERYGAGEIFLNSIDRDGLKQGYDLEILSRVSESVSIPVIACGGVGIMEHFAEGVIKGKASAVSAANIFHYTEHSTIVAKAFLRSAGIDVRLNTAAKYDTFSFDDLGRIMKKGESDLSQIWFEKHDVERI